MSAARTEKEEEECRVQRRETEPRGGQRLDLPGADKGGKRCWPQLARLLRDRRYPHGGGGCRVAPPPPSPSPRGTARQAVTDALARASANGSRKRTLYPTRCHTYARDYGAGVRIRAQRNSKEVGERIPLPTLRCRG